MPHRRKLLNVYAEKAGDPVHEIRQYHLSGEFLQEVPGIGVLHSSFEHAVNFCFSIDGENRMITVLQENAPLFPDSFLVPEWLFLRIKACADKGNPISIQKQYIRVGSTRIRLASECMTDLFLPHLARGEIQAVFPEHFFLLEEFIEMQERKSDMNHLPERFRQEARQLAVSLLQNDRAGAEYAFGHLIGAGKGLTPACDDAMVGILSVVCFYMTMRNRESGSQQYSQLVENILKRLKTERRTTQVSEKYLKCACRGAVSKPLGRLLEWLFLREGPFPLEEAVQIAATGHTSGMDTLYGIRCALALIKEKGLCLFY